MDSQSLIIGHPDTDTDNDYTNSSDISYQSSKAKQSRNNESNSAHLNFTDALNALREEGTRSQAAQESQADNIVDFVNDHPEDDETTIDRQVRLQNEEEADEQHTAGVTGRLTAPPSEIRSRASSRAPPINDVVGLLRQNQLKLVEEQLKLQKLLLENASLAQEDAKEQFRRQQILTENALIEQEILKQRLKLVTNNPLNNEKEQRSEE